MVRLICLGLNHNTLRQAGLEPRTADRINRGAPLGSLRMRNGRMSGEPAVRPRRTAQSSRPDPA